MEDLKIKDKSPAKTAGRGRGRPAKGKEVAKEEAKEEDEDVMEVVEEVKEETGELHSGSNGCGLVANGWTTKQTTRRRGHDRLRPNPQS